MEEKVRRGKQRKDRVKKEVDKKKKVCARKEKVLKRERGRERERQERRQSEAGRRQSSQNVRNRVSWGRNTGRAATRRMRRFLVQENIASLFQDDSISIKGES